MPACGGPISEFDRRTFLGLAGAGLAAACTPGDDADPPATPTPRTPKPNRPWRGVADEASSRFGAGVSAGDPRPDGVIVWTRYDGDAELTLSWATWDGEGWADAGSMAVTPADGG